MKILKFNSTILALLLFGSCAELQSPTGQAVLTTGEGLAKAAVTAAATTYGGPLAGQLASSGLDALATVLQAYVGSHVPPAIVKASPGTPAIGAAVAPLVSSNKTVIQADVNAVWQAAKLALK
jgi:hypothetical protein